MSENRCSGHCCRVFDLPFSPEELESKKRKLIDGEYVAAMVIHLGSGSAEELGFGPGVGTLRRPGGR